MISDKDVQTYQRDGVIVVPEVLAAATLSQVRSVIAELVAGSAKTLEHTDVYDLEPGHTAENPRVRRIKTPHKVHKLFDEIVRSEPVLDILKKLLGPGLRLHGSKLNMKSAQYGSPVEWHQDWAFYPHTNDDVLATGIYLDDCGMQNGPLLVVPGTHKGPVYDHHANGYFVGAMNPEIDGLDYANAVPLMGKAGSMTVHHVRLVHGSALNTSAQPRRLLLHEYAAADAWPLMGVANFEEFNGRVVLGRPTIEPRLREAPVRMPLPPAPFQGSIYENQRAVAKRFFAKAAA
jgi:ectoine hydroxylase-related dioxygenase (phytanoyl-CoA dioxygenase family)